MNPSLEPIDLRRRLQTGWFVAVVVSVVVLLCGLVAVSAKWETWPTSDLDGHLATIELYRSAIANGTLWPYDAGAAFGQDATPYYGWWFELALGLIAAAVQGLGVGNASVVVGLLVLVVSAAMVPLLAAWVAREACADDAGDDQLHRRMIIGALAGVAFLLFDNADGQTGVGLPVWLRMGMLNQGVGFVALLFVAGSALRVARLHLARCSLLLAAAVAFVLMVHMLSALAALVVLAILFIRGERLALMKSSVLGLLVAGGSLVPILILKSQQNDLNVIGMLTPMDPFTAAVAPYFSRGLSGASLSAEMQLQLALGLAGIAALWRSGTERALAIIGCCLCLMALVPLLQVLAIAIEPAIHPYRFLGCGALLLLIAGSGILAEVWARFELEVATPLRRIFQTVLCVGLAAGLIGHWSRTVSDDLSIPQVAHQLEEALPPGSRVLFANASLPAWHRTGIERMRSLLQISSANTLHSIYPPPVLMQAAQAGAAVGLEPWAFPRPEGWSEEEGIRGLRDLGITHLIEHRSSSEDVLGPRKRPPTTWSKRQVGDFTIWTVPETGPELEPIAGAIFRMSHRPDRHARLWLSEWWGRTRTEMKLEQRLVFDFDQASAYATLQLPEADGWLKARPLQIALVHGPEHERLAKQLYEDLAGVKRALVDDTQVAAARTGAAAVLWDPATQSAVLSGLEAGKPYLWRTSWSSGFSSPNARLFEEVGGFTVIVPTADQAVVQFSRATDGRVLFGLALSIVAISTWLMIAGLRIRSARREDG